MASWDPTETFNSADDLPLPDTDQVDDENEVDEVDETPESAATSDHSSKPRSKRKRSALTRAQVLTVLDTAQRLKEADDELVAILNTVLKTDTTEDLVVALTVKQTSTDDSLAELVSLLDVATSSPMQLGITIMGMDRAERGRVFGLLQEVTGDVDTLPRDEMKASMQVAELMLELSETQQNLLRSAYEFQG